MTKFPLLAQMRAERQRREDEITAPYKQEINGFQRLVSRLRDTVRGIERALGSEIGKHLADQIGHEMSRLVSKEIYQAVAKARTPDEPVTITLSAGGDNPSEVTTAQAAIALRNYLTTGEPRWSEALAG